MDFYFESGDGPYLAAKAFLSKFVSLGGVVYIWPVDSASSVTGYTEELGEPPFETWFWAIGGDSEHVTNEMKIAQT